MDNILNGKSYTLVTGTGGMELVAKVTATGESGPTGVQCKVEAIYGQGAQITAKVGDIVTCNPEELTLVDDNEIDPMEPDRFEGNLGARAMSRYPYPAHLGTVLMQNSGYIFARIPERFFTEDTLVPIYNISMLVGLITYARNGREIKVTIIDIPNSQGNILTTSARMAMNR